MHEHTDKPCKHDLKVCTDCGNVYCLKCNKEWFKDRALSYSYIPYTVYPAATYYDVSYTNGTDIHAHTHKDNHD